MKRVTLAIVAIILSGSLTGCASYNDHIRECDGDVSTAHLVFDYLPIGAVVDNITCNWKMAASAGDMARNHLKTPPPIVNQNPLDGFKGTDWEQGHHDADQSVPTPVEPALH